MEEDRRPRREEEEREEREREAKRARLEAEKLLKRPIEKTRRTRPRGVFRFLTQSAPVPARTDDHNTRDPEETNEEDTRMSGTSPQQVQNLVERSDQQPSAPSVPAQDSRPSLPATLSPPSEPTLPLETGSLDTPQGNQLGGLSDEARSFSGTVNTDQNDGLSDEARISPETVSTENHGGSSDGAGSLEPAGDEHRSGLSGEAPSMDSAQGKNRVGSSGEDKSD